MDWNSSFQKLEDALVGLPPIQQRDANPPPEVIAALHTLEWPKEGAVPVGLEPHQFRDNVDWCQGCDGLWRPWSMGWTELGLYRCEECRKPKPTGNRGPAPKRRIVLETVPEAQFIGDGQVASLQKLTFTTKEF